MSYVYKFVYSPKAMFIILPKLFVLVPTYCCFADKNWLSEYTDLVYSADVSFVVILLSECFGFRMLDLVMKKFI